MNATKHVKQRILIVKLLLSTLILAGLIAWLILTPSGFFGKLHAVGYSLCHQIAERSFFFYNMQMPLCSRCTGMYIGVLVGLSFLLPVKKRSQLPSKKIMVLLGVALILFAIDGINSYLAFLPTSPQLYASQNWLRLITGTMLGLAIPLFLVPIFNQTVWRESTAEPIVHTFRHFFLMLGIALAIDLVILADVQWLRFAFAILTIFTVVTLLTMVYTTLWIIILKKEYRFEHLRELWFWLVSGFGTALAQIAAMDAIRLAVTGTWASSFI